MPHPLLGVGLVQVWYKPAGKLEQGGATLVVWRRMEPRELSRTADAKSNGEGRRDEHALSKDDFAVQPGCAAWECGVVPAFAFNQCSIANALGQLG